MTSYSYLEAWLVGSESVRGKLMMRRPPLVGSGWVKIVAPLSREIRSPKAALIEVMVVSDMAGILPHRP